MNWKPVAGYRVGILCLETRHRLLPGNVQHAGSFPFPVMYETVPVESPWALMRGEASLCGPIVEAAQRLEEAGAPVIAGACGSFGYYQKELAAALAVPVFSSILTQIPFLLSATNPAQKLGVICASASSMNEAIYTACNISEPSRLRLQEMVDYPNFGKMLQAEDYDAAELQEETVDAARKLAAHGDVSLILFQCSDLPPFASAVQNAVGLPVFDMTAWIRALGFAAGYPVYPQ